MVRIPHLPVSASPFAVAERKDFGNGERTLRAQNYISKFTQNVIYLERKFSLWTYLISFLFHLQFF